MSETVCRLLRRYTRHSFTGFSRRLTFVLIWTRNSLTTMATQGRRSSPRLEEKAKKEAEDKEKEKEVKKPLEGLPANGSMKFVRDMIKSESQAFNIRRKHLYRTAGNTRVCSWAIHAYWDVSDFYPGQILRYTQTFPQTDLEAHYNGQLGSIAPTSVAPVGRNKIADSMLHCSEY